MVIFYSYVSLPEGIFGSMKPTIRCIIAQQTCSSSTVDRLMISKASKKAKKIAKKIWVLTSKNGTLSFVKFRETWDLTI